MFSHRSYSIYGRIVIIVLIPMLLLTCLLLGVYQVFYGMSLEQAKENFTLQTQQYTNSFERRFENIAALAQNVGYSEGVQKYFAQMTSQERVSSYKNGAPVLFHRFQNGARGYRPFMWATTMACLSSPEMGTCATSRRTS